MYYTGQVLGRAMDLEFGRGMRSPQVCFFFFFLLTVEFLVALNTVCEMEEQCLLNLLISLWVLAEGLMEDNLAPGVPELGGGLWRLEHISSLRVQEHFC